MPPARPARLCPETPLAVVLSAACQPMTKPMVPAGKCPPAPAVTDHRAQTVRTASDGGGAVAGKGPILTRHQKLVDPLPFLTQSQKLPWLRECMMAKLSQLVTVISEVVSVERVKIERIARFAREAGAISTGGRGPGGAEMTARDAAIIIGLLLQDGVAQNAVINIDIIRRMHSDNSLAENIDDLDHSQKDMLKSFLPSLLVPQHTFVDALESIVKSAIINVRTFERIFWHSWISFYCADNTANITFDTKSLEEPLCKSGFYLSIDYNSPFVPSHVLAFSGVINRNSNASDYNSELHYRQQFMEFCQFRRQTELGLAAISEIGAFLAGKEVESLRWSRTK